MARSSAEVQNVRATVVAVPAISIDVFSRSIRGAWEEAVVAEHSKDKFD